MSDQAASSPASRACLRYGWTALAVFLLLGLVLEFLHLIKAPFYMDISLRRELWTLAHAHGTLLAIINLVFAATAHRCLAQESARARASWLLRAGGLLVPAGFFLGGVANAEGDPSLFIVLVPAGALLALAGVAVTARGALAGDRAQAEGESRQAPPSKGKGKGKSGRR